VFFVLGPQRLVRQAHKRKEEIGRMIAHPSFLVHIMGKEKLGSEENLPDRDSHVLQLARQISAYEATRDNGIEVLLEPETALAEMQKAIDSAEQFVHLEYYILANDEVTEGLFDSLINAKNRGVEVRVLYDALGSLSLKKIYFRKLIQNGVKIAGFLPVWAALQRMNLNFRNHRKILIVDGKLAFTGGANIGREYLGARHKQQWRDYLVRVTGPVVLQLEDVFGKDWQFTTGEDLFHAKYYPQPLGGGKSVIQVLESGPDSRFQAFQQAVFLMVNSAQEEILLVTPYFIPDTSLLTSLSVAALRGVKVRLLLPRISDVHFVRWASRSFYDDLLRHGVEIYEYRPKILHAKLLTIDNRWSMLGSANMDIRSFRLNFELNLLVYGSEFASQARTFFFDESKKANLIDRERFERRGLSYRLAENACRLLSPIL
jgi:cardiolipin synthase A/B